jgi:RHS repeat-associated protein
LGDADRICGEHSRRTSKTVDGDTTEYVLDLAATLPVVVSDTQAVYLYGLDIIAQQQSERLYYVHDGLGSVRQLLDSAGEIQTNYAYDPFGVPLVGGEVYNPYQYTGEAWDAEVELLYLRARYYQPEVGRFITRDPWPGDYERPRTLNSYPYALNNPAAPVDPTGYNGEDGENGQEPDPLGLRGLQVCKVSVSVAPPEPMPFEEFKARYPPDPHRGLPPFPRFRLMSDAMLVYLREEPAAPAAARSGTDNPLADLKAMPGEIPLFSVWNGTLPPFIFPFFVIQLEMDETKESNFEPLFLTMLLHWQNWALEDAQGSAYEVMKEQGWQTSGVFEGWADYSDILPPSIE